jgi:hypothetical protein
MLTDKQESHALDDSSTPKLETSKKKLPSVPKITKKTAVVGAAIGIGSAAIVAALLYANRGNTKS